VRRVLHADRFYLNAGPCTTNNNLALLQLSWSLLPTIVRLSGGRR